MMWRIYRLQYCSFEISVLWHARFIYFTMWLRLNKRNFWDRIHLPPADRYDNKKKRAQNRLERVDSSELLFCFKNSTQKSVCKCNRVDRVKKKQQLSTRAAAKCRLPLQTWSRTKVDFTRRSFTHHSAENGFERAALGDRVQSLLFYRLGHRPSHHRRHHDFFSKLIVVQYSIDEPVQHFFPRRVWRLLAVGHSVLFFTILFRTIEQQSTGWSRPTTRIKLIVVNIFMRILRPVFRAGRPLGTVSVGNVLFVFTSLFVVNYCSKW